jgi:hypothetical protein
MENKPEFHPNPKLRLMDQVREVLRYRHYAYRTEQTYCQCQWILRYIHHFGGKTHPRYLGAKDVKTTEIYTHVMARDIRNLQSPLDRI